MDLNPTIALPQSLLSPLEFEVISGNFILREKEIPLRGYAKFDRLQLIIICQSILSECTVSFTNERLLMYQKLQDTVVGWGVERKYLSAIESCGWFYQRKVRLILNDPTFQRKDYFELKFPQENFSNLKNAFINILKMLDLCQACEEDRLEDFQNLLQSNLKLVNLPIDSKENTLLIMACAKNKGRIAQYLLGIHGIDINKTTEVKVMKGGKETKDVYGALYYACVNNMKDIVEKMLSIPTIDVNTLYTNELTALRYALRKDIASCPNSVESYADIISMLMSHPKTTWKIADNERFAIPTDWMLDITDDTRMAILSCERVKELPANIKQMMLKVIQDKLKSLRGMDSNSTIVLNATEDGEKLLPDQRTEVVNAAVTEETNQFNLVEDLSSKENPTRKPMKVLPEPTDNVSQCKNILVLSPISAGPTLAPGIFEFSETYILSVSPIGLRFHANFAVAKLTGNLEHIAKVGN
eukprot:gene2795-2977_t